jgi:hypothetical protein
MDSHPEEFVYDRKWDNFLPPSLREPTHKDLSMYKHFTSAERVAIYFKFRQLVAEVARPFAYGQILEVIVDSKQENHYGTTTVGALYSYTTPMPVEDMLDGKRPR